VPAIGSIATAPHRHRRSTPVRHRLVAGSTTLPGQRDRCRQQRVDQTATLSKRRPTLRRRIHPPSTPANVTAASSAWSSATVSWTASPTTSPSPATRSAATARHQQGVGLDHDLHRRHDRGLNLLHLHRHRIDAAANVSSAAAARRSRRRLGPPTDTQSRRFRAPGRHRRPGQIQPRLDASTDDTAVAGYNVYRDGTKIATTYSSSYADLAWSPALPHLHRGRVRRAANTSIRAPELAPARLRPAELGQLRYDWPIG